MFRNKIVCKECSEIIDAFDEECPRCHKHNDEYDKVKLSKNALNIPFVWQIIIFAVGWIGLQIIGEIVSIIALAIASGTMHISLTEAAENDAVLGITQFITYFLEVIALLVLIFIAKKDRRVFSSFKSWKSYVFGFVAFVAIYLVSFLYSGFIMPKDIGDSHNQEAIVRITKLFPVLSIIVFCFVGPLCEELTYRVGLFGFLRRWNRVAAYVISIVVFAIIHFDITVFLNFILRPEMPRDVLINNVIGELWNLPMYLIGAALLVTTYDLFGFGASLTAHILNNLISITEILVLINAGKN